MKKKKTQLLGIVLSAAMLATSVPAPVYAEPTDNVAEEENNGAVVAQEPTEDAENQTTTDITATDNFFISGLFIICSLTLLSS